MTDFIILAVIAVMITAIIRYLHRAKKNGAACVGCPSGACGGHCGGGDCHCQH